jgi:hypothetical protein
MKNIPIILLAFPLLMGTLPAQCVLDPIQSPFIEGYFLFGFEGKYRIVNKAEVFVLDQYNTHKVIAKTAVDGNGYFHIKKVKPGNYILSGRSEALISAYVDIHVLSKKEAMGSAQDSMVLIVLGGEVAHECGGSSITIKKKADIDRILQSAARK